MTVQGAEGEATEALRRAGLWNEAQCLELSGNASGLAGRHAERAIDRALGATREVTALAIWSEMSIFAKPLVELEERLFAARRALGVLAKVPDK